MGPMKGKLREVALIVLLCAPTLAVAATISQNVTVPTAHVTGSLSKGSGTFVIDDPIDPENKLLYHSFVESPDVLNVYDGIATLDARGQATVTLPNYFLALNKDFRYLLTAIGKPAPNLYIKEGVHRSYFGVIGSIVFTIAGGSPGAKVSWQVTGIRHDPYILANPILTEVPKTASTTIPKGEYLFPQYESYDQYGPSY